MDICCIELNVHIMSTNLTQAVSGPWNLGTNADTQEGVVLT